MNKFEFFHVSDDEFYLETALKTMSQLSMLPSSYPPPHQMEKPLLMSLGELDKLEALVERHPDRLMVGHNYRFNQTVLKLFG